MAGRSEYEARNGDNNGHLARKAPLINERKLRPGPGIDGGAVLLLLLAAVLLFYRSAHAADSRSVLQTIQGSARAMAVPAKQPAGPESALAGPLAIYDNAASRSIRLAADGSYQRAYTVEELASRPVDSGTWIMDGAVLVLNSSAAINSCGSARSSRYVVSQYESAGSSDARMIDACAAQAIGFDPTAETLPPGNQAPACRAGGIVICEG